MSKRIRIGLIGCGMIAGSHINGYLAHPQHAEIIAVCDTVDANVKAESGRLSLRCNIMRRIRNRRGRKDGNRRSARAVESRCCTFIRICRQRCQNLQRLQRDDKGM